MTPERHRQIGDLFDAALKLEPDGRKAFLDQACAEDPTLLEEIESLLDSHENAGEFIALPALDVAARTFARDRSHSPNTFASSALLGPYEILSLIGVGGMGEVYLAQDTRLDRRVALKILPESDVHDPERLQRFLQEAKAAAALNHPNVATIHEVNHAGGTYFIAMEYVDGDTLATRMQAGIADFEDIRKIITQIVHALAAAHAEGIVHRDLKPANIMVTARGHLKLLDFGVAKRIVGLGGATALTQAGALVGTAEYMSPEQALGRHVDIRSDIFSLGIIIYEMVTGRSPFAAANPIQAMNRIVTAEPEPMDHERPDVPDWLRRVTASCLQKDPDKRYPSVDALLNDLMGPSKAAPNAPPLLLGRKQECERLRETWIHAGAGRAMMAVIEGEAGMGKSRLAEDLYTWISRQAISAARTRCYSTQGQLAYSPAADLLRNSALRASLSALSSFQLSELARIIPEILTEQSGIPSPQPLTESWQRHHFFKALTDALGPGSSPLLLVIDDLQWCDRDTFEWLNYLFHTEPRRRLLVLGTVRSEEIGRDHPLTSLVRELRRTDQVVNVTIGPLDAGDTAALAAQVAQRELPAEYLSQLYLETKGHPLFVVESVRARIEDPTRVSQSARTVVREVITARLANLSADAYELASIAALIGQSFTFDLLAQAAESGEPVVERGLGELWERRIIQGTAAGAYEFTHDKIWEVACAEMNPVRKGLIHRRLGRSLEALHSRDTAPVSGRIAMHYAAAGMHDRAIPYYQMAAKVAQQMYGDGEAAVLLQRAVALCRTLPADRRRDELELELLVALGPSQVSTEGYGSPGVAETYRRALALAEGRPGTALPDVLVGNWFNQLVSARFRASSETAARLLQLARLQKDASLLAAAHLAFGLSYFYLGKASVAKQHLEEALAADVDEGRSRMDVFVGREVGLLGRAFLSHVLWHLGLADQSLQMMAEAMNRARKSENPFSLALASSYAAVLHLFRSEPERAASAADEALAICRQYNFPYYLAWSRMIRGWARVHEGAHDGGLEEMRIGLDELKATGTAARMPYYQALLANSCARAGRVEEGLAHVMSGFEFEKRNSETWVAAELHRINGDLLLTGNRNIDDVMACYYRAIEAARRTEALAFELRAATGLANLLIRLERKPEAASVLVPVYQRFSEGFDTPDLTAAALTLKQV